MYSYMCTQLACDVMWKLTLIVQLDIPTGREAWRLACLVVHTAEQKQRNAAVFDMLTSINEKDPAKPLAAILNKVPTHFRWDLLW